jgi:hypothetical protein
MKRMALLSTAFVVAVVAVTLVAAGCGAAQLQTTAAKPAAQVAAANPCAAKAAQPCAAKAQPCAAKPTQPCVANPCAPKARLAAAAQPCAAKPAQPCAPKNPCAPTANPCAAKNPCAPKANPCAAKNPCGPMQACAAKPAVARMIKGEIIGADLTKNLLSVRHEGRDLALQLDHLTAVRRGPTPMTPADLQTGQQATVSYVERNGQRTAKYIYLAAATAANPCGANPCAAKNPCAVKNPCAPKANPCAATGKNPCGANPCALQKR